MTLCLPIELRPGILPALAAALPERYPALLDSAAQGALSRYSILGAFPRAALWQDAAGQLHATGHMAPGPATDAPFLSTLQQWLRDVPAPATPEDAAAAALPFRGGWVVFLSYEMADEVEPRLKGRMPQGNVLRACALRIPMAVVADAAGGSWIVAEDDVPAADLQQLRDDLARHPLVAPAADAALGELVEEEPQAYVARVSAAQRHIAAGDIYQANLSRRWDVRVPPEVPTGELYRRLRFANPAPFAALLQFRDLVLLSSSPERLARLATDRRVDTRPIAGTHPRGATPEADAALARALVEHPKERAEHVMLIDLERNDLGRVCEAGSVQVDEYMGVETYTHVHHIVSNVTGTLRADRDVVDLLRAVFPGGTITGCPKLRCMEIIAELEGEARGAYTGSLGFINRDGSADFNILIRTMTRSGDSLRFRAGAGIVADSDPQRELQETRNKARGMVLAISPRKG